MEAPRSTSTVRSADTYGIAIASGAVSGRRVTKNENGFRAASSPTGRSLGRHYKIRLYYKIRLDLSNKLRMTI